MKATLDYDTHYHERNKEKKQYSGGSTTLPQERGDSSNNRPKPKKKNHPPQEKKRFDSSRPPLKTSISHISRDGTLKHHENEHFLKEGLCTYCSAKHKLKDFASLKEKNARLNQSSHSFKPKKA